MKWLESAPSNIALIKYMGKTDSAVNKPTNSSLSYTLNNLRSFVLLEANRAGRDVWQPLIGSEYAPFEMSAKGQNRFLKHFQNLKAKYGIEDAFTVSSANNFPSDCGLASSASSFAALTKAAVTAFAEIQGKPVVSTRIQADLSRQGSGSSCRSFFSPWCLWNDNSVTGVDIPYQHLLHSVIVVENSIKKVSSSEAHKRVTSSDLFEGRPSRAENRLKDLLYAFEQQNWSGAYELCWAEFFDMHALFETSKNHFSYMTEGSLKVLRFAENIWEKSGDGPLVTMDAGPNVHLLFREDQVDLQNKIGAELGSHFKVMSSGQEVKK